MTMSNFTPLALIKEKWQTILSITLLVALLVFVLSIVQPAKYRSSTRLLVVQNYSLDVDPFAASRSTDHLSNILSEIIYSTAFFDQVMKSGFDIKDDFSVKAEKRKKQWQKMIRSKVISDTGIIAIDVYHHDRYQTGQISYAVAHVLMTKNSDYHGGGEGVVVKTIDAPITTIRPAQPKTLLNTVVGLVLGLIAGGAMAYFLPHYELKPISAASLKYKNWRERKKSLPNIAAAYQAQSVKNESESLTPTIMVNDIPAPNTRLDGSWS